MTSVASPDSVPPSSYAASPQVSAQRRYTVAVVGNPNTGKTTLFNALTGLSQHTGNYPGVTVESALGEFTIDGQRFLAVDLPGTYSLAPRAPDEMIAVSVLLGLGEDIAAPDVVLCVLDATHLDRNLYLLTQVLEVGLPVVAALTMTDLARKQGIVLDVPELENRLGAPVIPVQATKRLGIHELKQAVGRATRTTFVQNQPIPLPVVFTTEVDQLLKLFAAQNRHRTPSRFLIERLLIDAGGSIEQVLIQQFGVTILPQVTAARTRLATAGASPQQLETDARYRWISQVIEATVRQPQVAIRTWNDRIDAVVTHKVWGLGIFLMTMVIVFQAIFSWSAPLMDGIEATFGALGIWIGGFVAEGPLQSLLVDGIVGGVGAVVVFVPQIALLFGLIAVLEDSGYMARAAFLMDRVMASFGLSGRSFIPLLSSFACAVPGIMATRSIDNRRDRIATILIAPLMSCSARLPVYVLFISAFIPAQTVLGVFGLQGTLLFVMYLLGLVFAPPIAFLLKRTMLKGESVPFLLELPPFQVPAWRVVLFRMYDRSWAFIKRAGTIILATTILVWALSYYPHQPQIAEEFTARRATAAPEEMERLNTEEAGARLRGSYLGQAGHTIEPLVRPLGWDWKIGMATLASFPAREVIIAALGTIYNLGNEQDEESVQLREAMRAERWPDGRLVYTPVVAVSVMVFFALCCQCGATLATIKRETGSWGYAAFTFTYMTSLAYLGALLVYQVGSRLVDS
ncbi:MAG: ferrous iron transport protein B [Deltaproteobacteria bacterium]|nr:ferrous iron transport protein B [Deltaproteobacteria bacterium]